MARKEKVISSYWPEYTNASHNLDMKEQITVTDVHISLRWLPSLFLFFIKNGESEKSKQN